MIDFAPNSTQRDLQRSARRFAREAILPVAAQHDREASWPQATVSAAAEAGFLNLLVPERHGGLGLGVMEQALILEELAFACMGITTILMASDLGVTPVLLHGSDEQQERWLAPLTTGPKLAAFALSEADAGSDPGGLRTRAVDDGDAWIVSGSKMWISNGGRAAFTVVFATTEAEAFPRAGVALIVPADAPGLSWNEIHGKLGQRAAATYEMVLDEVRVPKQDQLAAVGEGAKVALSTLDRSRIPVAAASVGVTRRALHEAVRYASQRRTFGVPIARHQAVGFRLADMRIAERTSRLQTWYAAWLADRGEPCGHDAAIAKAYASDVAYRAAGQALDVHGGYGYVDEYPVEKLLRDVKLNQIYEGTNDIQRLIIARDLVREAEA